MSVYDLRSSCREGSPSCTSAHTQTHTGTLTLTTQHSRSAQTASTLAQDGGETVSTSSLPR